MNIITRLIAQVTIQHTAVNYPLIDYAGVTSLTPTKLYSDPRVKPGEFSVFNFPNANTAAVSELIAIQGISANELIGPSFINNVLSIHSFIHVLPHFDYVQILN